MKAAVHVDAYRLDVLDLPVPKVADYDHVLLKVGAVGICGSDKHDLDHPPLRDQIPGHEFAGVIEELGDDPGGFCVGDRVLARPRCRCGECGPCRQHPRGECERRGVFGCRGPQQKPGAMAEYVLVRTENLTKVPEAIPLEQAAMADPVAVAVHSVNDGPPVEGRTCVIMGAGVIGLLLGQVLTLRGASRVVMVDVRRSHLDVAKRLGDFDCILAGNNDELIAQLTDLRAGVYYELAGGESPTLDIAVKSAAVEGHIVLVSQRPKGVWLDYQLVLFKRLTLSGIADVSDAAWAEAVSLILGGRVNVAPLITHRYPLQKVNEALMMAIEGDSLKVVIQPNGEMA